MFRFLRPTGLMAVILIAACTTTMVADRSGNKFAALDPDVEGLVNRRSTEDRAPAAVRADWANVPGFVDPNDPALRAPVTTTKIDKNDSIEYRTPSALLFSVYIHTVGGKKQLNVGAIQQKIDEVANLSRLAENVPDVNKRVRKSLKAAKAVLENAREEARRLNSSDLDLSKVEDLNSRDIQSFYSNLFQGLEMIDVARSEDPSFGKYWRRNLMHLNWFNTFRVTNENRSEAMNLEVPAEIRSRLKLSDKQAFFHPSQLTGVDLSKLDPIESGFWRKTDVASFNTNNYNGDTLAPADADLANTRTPLVAVFDDYNGGGSTAKMDVKLQIGDDLKKFKMKFRTRAPRPESGLSIPATVVNFLMHMSEVNTETTVNNLAAALGYSIAPTYYKDEVHLYLPGDAYAGVHKKAIEEKYDADMTKLALKRKAEAARNELVNNLIKHGASATMAEAPWDFAHALNELVYNENFVNEKGERLPRWYVKVKGASLEERVDTKFGFALKANFGRAVKREFRAFSLFLAWIEDGDSSDHNSDVRFQYDESTRRVQLSYVAADMGSSLGFFQGKDAPHVFNSNIVSKADPKGVELTFRTRHFSPIFRTITVSDAKWFVRRLAQLSESQIGGALAAGGYDLCTADVYKSKLMRRRDQLVAAFGLQNEFKLFRQANADRTVRFTYQPPAGCEKFYQGDKLIATPDRALNEHDISFSSLGDKDSPQRGFLGAMKNHLWSMTADNIGSRIQRYSLPAAQGYFDGVVRHTSGRVLLLPFRFPIVNPYRDPYKPSSLSNPPYWIVGVSRFGLGTGYMRTIPNAASRFRSLAKFDADVTAVWVKERIEIQPAMSADVDDVVKHYYQVFDPRNILSAWEGISAKTVESLTDPTSLVINSTYLVGGASVKSPAGMLLAGPFVGVGGATSVIKRSALMRESADHMLAIRSVGNTKEIKLEGGLSAVIFTLPLFSVGRQSERDHQIVYRLPTKEADFDSIVDEVLDLKVEDIGKNGGKFGKYVMTDRDLESSGSNIGVSLFGFKNWYTQNKRTVVTQVTKNGDEKVVETLDVRIRGSGSGRGFKGNMMKQIRDDFTVTGVLANGKSVSTTTNWTFKRDGTNRRELAKYAARVFPVFPMSLRQVPDSELNNNLVVVDFDGYIAISDTGWNKILSSQFDTLAAKRSLCQKWLGAVDFERLYPENTEDAATVRGLCDRIQDFASHEPNAEQRRMSIASAAFEKEKMANLTGSLTLFLKRIERAARLHAQNADGSKNTQLRDAVVDLVYIKEYPEFILKVLKGMMSEADYYQYAKLESSAEGGLFLQASKFEVAKEDRGGLGKEAAEAIRHPVFLLQNYAQKALDTLEQHHTFFDYFFIERVGNRIRLRNMQEVTQTLPQ